MGSLRGGIIPAWNVGTIRRLGRCRTCEAFRNGRQVATPDAAQGGARAVCGPSLTCASGRCAHAGRSGDWASDLEVFLGQGKLSAWTSVKVRECYSEVEQEDEDRQSIVQDILRKSTGLPEADHRASRRTGVTLSYVPSPPQY